MLASLIPRWFHGLLDYLWSILLIAAPWVCHFSQNRAGTYVSVGIGVFTILYSLLTNYEFGLIRVIPMIGHLWIDLIIGVILSFSFFDVHFMGRGMWILPVAGMLEAPLAILTSRYPTNLHPKEEPGQISGMRTA